MTDRSPASAPKGIDVGERWSDERLTDRFQMLQTTLAIIGLGV